jgi:acyl phosphate:glycerol-3-phosphate acyltransferase
MIIAGFVAVAILGYLLGSVPFGFLIGKLISKVDVRKYGSGKTGGTNLLRTVGLKWAIAVAALDLIKAVLAVVFAGLIIDGHVLTVYGIALDKVDAQVLAAAAAMAGHIWPVFLGFQGGRGVATFYGGMLILCPLAAVAGGLILIITVALTRFASLGSIVGATGSYVILFTLVIVKGYPVECLIFALFAALLIIAAHHDNIGRLISGKERRIGQRAEKRGLGPFTTKGT